MVHRLNDSGSILLASDVVVSHKHVDMEPSLVECGEIFIPAHEDTAEVHTRDGSVRSGRIHASTERDIMVLVVVGCVCTSTACGD